MNDELVARYGDVLDDLRKLTSHELSHLRCSEFRGIARVVLEQLGVRVEISDGRRRAEAYFVVFVVPAGLALAFTGDLNYLGSLGALVAALEELKTPTRR